MGFCLELKLRNIPSCVVTTCILHSVHKVKRPFQKPDQFWMDPQWGGTLALWMVQGIWRAEVVLLAEHSRQNHTLQQ